MATNTPQTDYQKTALRLPKDLHAQIHAAAQESGRSYNAEIVDRLYGSFEVNEGVPEIVMEALEGAAEKWGIPLEEAHARVILAGVNKDAPQVIMIRAKGGMTVAEVKALFEVAKECTSPDATVYFEKS